jgi:hypothetical protein
MMPDAETDGSNTLVDMKTRKLVADLAGDRGKAEQPPRRVLASRRLLFSEVVCRVLIPPPEGRGGRDSKRGW